MGLPPRSVCGPIGRRRRRAFPGYPGAADHDGQAGAGTSLFHRRADRSRVRRRPHPRVSVVPRRPSRPARRRRGGGETLPRRLYPATAKPAPPAPLPGTGRWGLQKSTSWTAERQPGTTAVWPWSKGGKMQRQSALRQRETRCVSRRPRNCTPTCRRWSFFR